MRGNSLNFFKPSVTMKTFLIFCAIFGLILFNSCKQLASFDPNVEGARAVANKTLSAPAGMEATHGLKRKITLTWIPVSGASRYEIYCATSATAEFEKIGETDKNFFDDKNVGAGKTFYYKVRAVKSNGTQSPFSVIKKGTSLAQPIIIGGDVKEDYSVTISWFMENSCSLNGDDDNYEEFLKFDICYKLENDDWKNCKKETIDASSASGSFLNSYECTLTNLANASKYQFRIDAYTGDDGSESSDVVNKATMISYNPVAPKFEASEGTSSKEISLSITLPPMVMVHTVTKNSNGEEKDVEFPLYFEIYRKLESESEYTMVKKLYCDGSSFAPEYSNNLEDTYKPDSVIEWIDEDSERGIKYEYMIRSSVDVGYGKIVCPEGTELIQRTGMPSESKVGWKSAPPVFEINRSRFENNGLKLSDDRTKICSVLFGFDAEWNDLGKADGYKFAIKQNRRSLTDDENASGVDTWFKNNGSDFFATLAEINKVEIKFGSERGGLSEDDKGLYVYTLYIVPKNAEFVEGELDGVLDDKVTDEVRVTDEVKLPKAEFKVEGGYNDKVKLIISNYESDVRYVVTRTLEGGTQADEAPPIVLNDMSPNEYPEDGTRVYYDKNVTDNCMYSYVLKATASSGGCKDFDSQIAETLGTPKVLVENSRLKYDSVEFSFDGVLAAKNYTVKLGAEGGFGGGETFDIIKSGDEWNSENVSISSSGNSKAKTEVKFSANKFTVTIKEPDGYDDATLAGNLVAAVVTAKSDVDEAASNEQVKVLGPAQVGATVNAATENSISITWSAVEGANGYLIRRVMYDAEMESVVQDSGITYYYDVSGRKIALAGGGELDGRATVDFVGGKFQLVDNYMDADNPEVGGYQKEQEKIFWGLPFKYVVLPVLKDGDFDFETDSFGLGSGSSVAYKAISQTDPIATFGYGMNVHAEKSKSVSQQTITWKKPYNNGDKEPRVFRRKAGTQDNFERVNSESLTKDDTKFSYIPEAGEKYEAYEYIVKYNATAAGFVPPKPLIADFENAKDEESATEQKNKGYILAAKLSADIDTENPYYETIDWWDYSKRAIGPDKVTLSVYNNNIKDGWVDVLTADNAGSVTLAGDNDITKKDAGKPGSVSVAPKGIVENGSGTTDGMLKVLRDYKHYYKLVMEGKDKTGVPISCEVGIDKDVFAYRQITDEELVRAATLAMTIGMENAYNMKSSTWSRAGNPSRNYTTANNGSVSFNSTTGSPYHVIEYTNFTAPVVIAGNTIDSFLTLSGTLTGTVSTTTDSCPPEKYNGSITISSNIDLYNNVELKFTDLKKDNGSISCRNSKFSNITPLPFKPDNYKYTIGIGAVITAFSGHNNDPEWQ